MVSMMMKGRIMVAVVMVGMVAVMTRPVMVTAVALLSVSESSREVVHLLTVTKSVVIILMAAVRVIKSVLVALESSLIVTTMDNQGHNSVLNALREDQDDRNKRPRGGRAGTRLGSGSGELVELSPIQHLVWVLGRPVECGLRVDMSHGNTKSGK